MKLPGIPGGRVEALRAPEPDLSEAQAAQALGSSLQQLGQAAINIQMNKWKREEEQANLDIKKFVIDTKTDVFNKDFYRFDQLPADAVGKINGFEKVVDGDGNVQEVGRQNIPASEIWGAVYEDRVNNAINSISDNMTHDGRRDKWIQAQQINAGEDFLRMQEAIEAQQLKQHRALQEHNIEMYLENGMYEDAREIIPNLAGAEQWEKDAALREVNYDEEFSGVQDEIVIAEESGDVTELEKLADYYNPENENPTHFNSTQREAVYSEIKAQINNIRSRAKAERAIMDDQLQYDLNQAVDVLNSGKPMDQAQLSDLRDRVDVSDAIDPTTAFTSKQKFKDAMIVNGVIREWVTGYTPTQVQEEITSTDAFGSIRAQDLFNQAIDGYNEFLTAVRTDGMVALDQYGVMDIEPIDLTSADSLTEGIMLREHQWKEARQRYQVTSPMFSDEEIAQFGRHLDGLADNNERLAFIHNMTNAVTPDMQRRFWSSMADNREIGPYVVIGDLFRVNPVMAQRVGSDILNGIDAMRRDPSIIEDLRNRKDDMRIAFGAGYANYLSDVRDNYVDAAVAYMAVNTGKWGSGTAVNETDVTNALNAVTGGVIQYQGAKFIAPVYNMGEDQFADWIENLHSSYLDQQGGVATYRNAGEVLSHVRDGRIQLRPSGIDRTLFYLMDTGKNNATVMMKNGEPLLLPYNPNAPKRNRDGR